MNNVKKNLTLYERLNSYKYYFSDRIKYFRLYQKTFKNYFSVMIHVLRSKYPFEGVLRNNDVRIYNNYSEIFNTLMNLDYNADENSVTISIRHSPQKIKLFGVDNSGDISSVYQEEDYRFLPSNNKVVIDVGSNIADSSIYFALKGAKKVIALDPSPRNYYYAKKNVAINNLTEKIQVLLAGCSSKKGNITSKNGQNHDKKIPLISLEEILKSNFLEDGILKIDCEGCEYNVILSASKETLRKFTHIQIEYHYGYRNLRDKLERCGFHVLATNPKFFKPFYLNDATLSVHSSKNSSEFFLDNKPIYKKMYMGWIYATRK